MDEEIKYSLITEKVLRDFSNYKETVEEDLARGKINNYSLTTVDILSRIEKYKKNIFDDRVSVNGYDILKGISIVEEILREVNPSEINDEVVDYISRRSQQKLSTIEYINQNVNFGVWQGLEQCISLIYVYNNVKRYSKTKELSK